MTANIEAIKEANRIEEVVTETHPLKQERGHYARAVEHNSLVVDTRKQYYFWNSQGHAGDVINWLENTRRMTFQEAIEYLARRGGVPLQWDGKEAETYKATRAKQDALTTIANYLSGMLRGSATAMEWAMGRGWSAETLEQAGCGYWDGNTRALIDHLKMHEIDVTRPEVVAMIGFKGDIHKWAAKWGLDVPVSWLKEGQIKGMPPGMFVYAHFVGSHCCYLSGRSIEGKRHHNLDGGLVGGKQPYWNFEVHPKCGYVVFVEGQADALTLAQWGIPAVALAGLSLGDVPALTERLKGIEGRFLALDGDEAGQGDIQKWGDVLGPLTGIVSWPKGKDANEFLQAGGTKAECQAALDAAAAYIIWLGGWAAAAPTTERRKIEDKVWGMVAKLGKRDVEDLRKPLAKAMGITVGQFDRVAKVTADEIKAEAKKAANGLKDTQFMAGGFIEDTLFEMIYDPEHEKGPRTAFAVRMPDGQITIKTALEFSHVRVLPFPPTDSFIKDGGISFASHPEDYGDQGQLVGIIRDFLHKYVDVPPDIEQIGAYYALMTWMADLFNKVPYLRALGELGSGKTRYIDMVGMVAFRAMRTVGSSSVASIFRTIDLFDMITLVMDEADFKVSDSTSEIINLINTGNTRKFPVWRVEQTPDGRMLPRAHKTFGPKLFSQRQPFLDDATNSRCITWTANGGIPHPRIPIYLPEKEVNDMALMIRNMCLMYRLKNWRLDIEIDYNAGDPRLPGRLREITVALKAVAPELAKEIDRFMLETSRQMIADWRSKLEAKVLHAILRCYYRPIEEAQLVDGKLKLAMKYITKEANRIVDQENDLADGDGEEEKGHFKKDKLTARGIGHVVRNKLNLRTEKGTVGTQPIIVVWDEQRIESLCYRYGLEEELEGLRKEPELQPIKQQELKL
jgi:hypothetical protein